MFFCDSRTRSPLTTRTWTSKKCIKSCGQSFACNVCTLHLHQVFRNRILNWPGETDVQSFLLVHLFTKLGTAANDAATSLKLLEKGLSKEDLALAVLVDFPFQIIFGWLAARWSSGDKPLRPVCPISALLHRSVSDRRSLSLSKVVEGNVVSVAFRSRIYAPCRRLSFTASLDTLFPTRRRFDSLKLFCKVRYFLVTVYTKSRRVLI
jgi:hypothetical protein